MKSPSVVVLLLGVLACGASSDEVHLSWDPVSGDDIAGYNVYRSEQSGRGYLRVNTEPVQQPAYTDTTVERGKTYYYRVTTINTAGLESEFSEERSKRVD